MTAGEPAACQRCRVLVDGAEADAVCYTALTGAVRPGDHVLLNTTAVSLGLGSGGHHFIMWVLGRRSLGGRQGDDESHGHIVKLRYTPWQIRVLAAEEEGSPARQRILACRDLAGMPVVAAELHSQVAPVVAAALAVQPWLRVAYVMTDGGALPAAYSRTAAALVRRGWLRAVITAGHAFGGHWEAVNTASALLVARAVVGADLTVVAMGPGIVGTGTRLGFSGLEQAHVLDAAAALGGQPVAVLRLSGADARARHRGLSHHTETVGGFVRSPVWAPWPEPVPAPVPVDGRRAIERLASRHAVVAVPTAPLLSALRRAEVPLISMGRSLDDDPAFFLAAAAAGWLGARLASARVRRGGER
ncbi:MAG: DUF3866 family protein [Clostridia bacterium]|nr:DUF3866 family protein [Clostridia bacterium]